MKIIDRYVLSMFIKNYLIAFMVLIGMYVALDLVFNFGNMTESKTTTLNLSAARIVYDIADYYFYQCFVFFVQLSGMIAVVAAGFTLMRLSRFNEMTALLAAGTPLFRVALSVVVAGAVLNLILLPLDQEVIIPRMIPKLIREHGDVHEETAKAFPVYMMPDDQGGLFNAARYSPWSQNKPATVLYLDVIQRDPSLRPVSHTYASQAVWNNTQQQWDLTDGWRVPISPPDDQPRTPVPVQVAAYKSGITPIEINLNLGKNYIQLLPTSQINQLLNMKRYGTLDLLRTKDTRFAQWICNIFLLLLAISTVLTREPGALKASAMKCLLLTGLCMGCVFVTHQMAGSTPGNDPSAAMVNFWPALMAWVPIFIFGPLSIYLLDHVKS